MPLKPLIRPMESSDWDQVSEIYAAGIATGISTFESALPSFEKWDANHLPVCRFVVELDGRVAGFAVLSSVSHRVCFNGVAEVSIYVAPSVQGQGIGKVLLSALIEASEQAGFWSLLSVIFPENEKSLALHTHCGFRIIGRREGLGRIADGSHHDAMMLERRSATVGR